MKNLAPRGYFQLDATASVRKATPPDTDCCFFQADGGAIRWRDDGGTPTASVGHPLADGAALSYSGQLNNLRFIRSTGAATNVNISLYRALA